MLTDPITFEDILNMFPDATEAKNAPILHKNEENIEHWGNIFPNVSDFDFIPAPGETNDDFSDNILKVAPPPKIEK